MKFVKLSGICLLFLLTFATAFAQSDNQAQQTADWLIATHQNEDGGYSSFSMGTGMADSDVGGTIDALIGLSAVGEPSEISERYLLDHATALLEYAQTDGGSAGKLLLALSGIGIDPRNFAGHDFVSALTDQAMTDGSYNAGNAFNQALALLGLASAGETAPTLAIDWLVNLQAQDGELAGSWDDGFGTAGNPDATAMALMALAAHGMDIGDLPVENGLAFLQNSELPDGGWEYGTGFGANASSTALVLQAYNALNRSVDVGVLTQWQGESGALQADFGEGLADNFFTTAQGLPALAGKTLPITTSAGTETSESFVRLLPNWVGWAMAIGSLFLAGFAYFAYQRRM